MSNAIRMTKRATRPRHIAAVVGLTAFLAIAGAAIVQTGTTTAVAEQAPQSAQAGPVELLVKVQAPAPAPATAAPAAPAEPQEPAYYDIPLSHDLQDHVRQEAEAREIPPELILAMMDQESDYRTDLVSTTNDYGVMQINRINHDMLREELGITDFMDPEQNITCGTYMIGQLVDKFDGDLHRALTSYNRGETGARRYYERNGTYETSYSRSIVEIYEGLLDEGVKECR